MWSHCLWRITASVQKSQCAQRGGGLPCLPLLKWGKVWMLTRAEGLSTVLSAAFPKAKDPNRVHLLSLWKFKSCGTGKIWLVCSKYWCTLVCPCVFGEYFLAKRCTGITKGVKENWLQASKGWARREMVTIALYFTWRRNVWQPGAGRTSVQPQPQNFNCPLAPKPNFFVVFLFCGCFLRMLERLRLWFLFGCNTRAAHWLLIFHFPFVLMCMKRTFNHVFHSFFWEP